MSKGLKNLLLGLAWVLGTSLGGTAVWFNVQEVAGYFAFGGVSAFVGMLVLIWRMPETGSAPAEGEGMSLTGSLDDGEGLKMSPWTGELMRKGGVDGKGLMS
jgi:hypothetical protein